MNDRNVNLEEQAANTVLAKIPDKQQAVAFREMLADPMPIAAWVWMAQTVPRVLLAKRLDPKAYDDAYAKLTGQRREPDTNPGSWRLTGTAP